MKTRSRRGPAWRAAGLAALTAVLLLSQAVVGEAGAATERGGVRISERSARRAAEFWTPARMRRAKPVELPARRRAGGPASRPAGATAPGFDVVPDPTTPAARVHGVVFFDDLFALGRCSGTAVEAGNRSVVFTAGHCVEESISLLGGSLQARFWKTRNWVFVPAYRHGQRPFGVFAAKWLGATREWLLSQSPNSDVGVAVVGRNERGERLQQAVGGTGIAWNLPPRQEFEVHGYPVERPYGGKVQRRCAASPYAGHDVYSYVSPGPLNLGAECRVSGGASGGGWTIGDGVLNSVSSYSYGGSSGTVFGPYFGKEVARLYRRAERIR